MKQIASLLVLLCLHCTFGTAHGAVVVQYYSDSDCSGLPIDEDVFAFGEDFTISVTNDHCYVRIYASPSSGNIGRITVEGSGTEGVWVFVTTNITFGSNFPTTVGCANWEGLVDERGNINLKARISQDLLDSIDVSNLWNLQVGGQIQDSVSSDGGYFGVIAGSTTSTGQLTQTAGSIASVFVDPGDFRGAITAVAGNVGPVTVTSGSLLANVKATAGSLDQIRATQGNIGSPSNVVSIEAAAAASGIHINTVTAQNVYAHIDCNTSTPAVDGTIRNFFVGNGELNESFGDFHGSLKFDNYTLTAAVCRDLYGTVHCGTAFPATKDIIVGRSLKSGASVNFPASGLLGHVGIGRLHETGSAWESGESVNVQTGTPCNPVEPRG